MKHLIITTATIPEDICYQQLGYSYVQRMKDYKLSFDHALKFRENFDTITILETVAKEKVDELEECGINVYYSKFNNSFSNKGLNEIFHIQDFLNNSNFNDDDLIIKITGRYLMVNDNILNIDSNIVAKYDGDIYPGDRGVHTFFFGIKKNIFNQFIKSLYFNIDYTNICVEWLLKDFMINNNIPILSNSYKLGVITCLYSKELIKWTKVLS